MTLIELLRKRTPKDLPYTPITLKFGIWKYSSLKSRLCKGVGVGSGLVKEYRQKETVYLKRSGRKVTPTSRSSKDRKRLRISQGNWNIVAGSGVEGKVLRGEG